jgi:hypothetical protein
VIHICTVSVGTHHTTLYYDHYEVELGRGRKDDPGSLMQQSSLLNEFDVHGDIYRIIHRIEFLSHLALLRQ